MTKISKHDFLSMQLVITQSDVNRKQDRFENHRTLIQIKKPEREGGCRVIQDRRRVQSKNPFKKLHLTVQRTKDKYWNV